MDGLLTRDLQIRPEAKFAFFIRPLPSRAKQLSAQANLFRRRLLKVDTVTKARRRSAPALYNTSQTARTLSGTVRLPVFILGCVCFKLAAYIHKVWSHIGCQHSFPCFRWYKAVRMVVMRQRCTRQALKDAPVQPARIHTNTVPFSSFFGSRVTGPQLSLVFIMHPPDKYPGHPDFKAPPPAELDVEVTINCF